MNGTQFTNRSSMDIHIVLVLPSMIGVVNILELHIHVAHVAAHPLHISMIVFKG